MTEITDFLIAHGVLGMFIAAFLAGTFLPFASEVVLLGLLAAGADPVGLLIWGTIGNLLGGMFNYWIGTKGKEDWIEKYAIVMPLDLHKGLRHVRKYGAWAGLLAWVPILGSILTVSMGFLRTNLFYSAFTIAWGKFTRDAVIVSSYASF